MVSNAFWHIGSTLYGQAGAHNRIDCWIGPFDAFFVISKIHNRAYNDLQPVGEYHANFIYEFASPRSRGLDGHGHTADEAQ